MLNTNNEAACKVDTFPLENVLLILDNKLIRVYCTVHTSFDH